MLQLFGSGLISLWLEMAGVQPKPVDVLDFFTFNSRPGLVLTPDSHPFAADTVQAYLQQLEATGLARNNQGIWLQSGPVLLANNQGTQPLPAASITKVATSLAALKTWGPDHQFETLVGATGPINNGIVQGDLVIQGGGDPFFVWEEAIALGNSLNRMGIKRITGNLVMSGNFAMNYKTNPLQAGQLLQQAMNAATWSREVTVQYLTMPQGTPRPQVAIAGTVQVASLPNPKQILLVRHRSLPLSEILREMNIYSNNEMSEMLAQNLGGAQVVQSIAATTAKVPPQEIQLINGSGLGVENRISPRAACAMLMAIQRELLPAQLSVADLFPVSGRDRRGTMEARRIPQAAVIKTGTLRDVSALAGVLPTRDRGLVWFAIINRGTNVEGLRARQDQLLQSLLKQWQVTATVPAAIAPRFSNSTPIPLGAASRNEILYGG
ncbi:peptidase S13 D-Ala-D-Ala carboxypeptidase C [Gloeocapsa sp. PCC 7428]|uniref:D-alanyl-D-alanine carboxypeptidase n=1 Tax=Gloeocapsa sp. PCC 7428 TaxID=1173026 RepID=UPI0002A5F068|nr:D-alanyl-D-alanine carboxypeptidase [Gloeocapsa sp. PCC 7428]AFZ31935.1 peptidase S13 D-Ala-D-Ala carboxypeptidase C [Gloeocapsa sp. PCC 7428]